MYMLAAGMRPRMLMTIDEDGKMLPVSVRVGQAVDVVAQVLPFPPHPTPYSRMRTQTHMRACARACVQTAVVMHVFPDIVTLSVHGLCIAGEGRRKRSFLNFR